MNKKTLLILAGFFLFAFAIFFKYGSGGTAVLWNISGEGKWLLPLVGISALIDSINPCAFSILLLTVAFLFSVGKLRSNILKIGGFYILGIFIAYILIGLGIFHALHIFNTPHFMGKLGATLLIALGGINLINVIFPAFPVKLKIPDFAHAKIAGLMDKASLPTAFAMGVLVGLCEFPCTGGPYLMVLGLLHDRVTYFAGVGYLLLYNILFVLPLVTILLFASHKNLLEKVSAWQREERIAMRVWGGIAMVALGIIIFFI
ncbi:MAG: hypothetical protein UW30_C0015G0019 [Candidatus Giovannonibacteria bacterium GW2011_GWA2_44_13b]|uniref:Uncharacterized protein n=2 Tax=Candidatus Giovannoniibacteriota TaxID=1752738 RepID=A0A0G1H338_9BACT|nr:MAG: hypothetical protein UW30_C0015G0019 [Candidatus Giovannonibacteria bacterium GW2011_GWA2_44_13b]OGF82457.1 MAG: hypothetical protein A2924_01215 [Candidatus Giovannonibacteria bacterium RIFCSPLOWO2_01_FULL_44_16]